MFIRFILLLTIVIIAVQGEISSSTILSDAVKLTKLYKKYIDHPTVIQILDQIRNTCPWMLECCPNELTHFSSLMIQDKLQGQCSSSAKKVINSRPTCGKPPAQMSEDHDRNDVNSEPPFTRQIRTWINHTETVCSPDELQAFYCEKNPMKKFRICQAKTLQLVYGENGEKNYITYVNQLEKDLITVYKESIDLDIKNKM